MIAGVSSYAFGWGVAHGTPPVDEHALIAFARRHGFGVVQVADNLPVHTFTTGRLAEFVDAARASGVAIELGARGLTSAHLATYVELCRRCDAALLRFVADGPDYEPSIDDLVGLLREAVPALEAAGVTLAIENHDRFGARTLRDLIARVGSTHVGICLDTANSFGAGEGLAYVTDVLAPVTVNLHVKDITIRRLPYLMGFTIEGAVLGEGSLPIAETIAQVAQAGRCRSVILETWTPPGETHDVSVARELASAEAGAATLRRLLAR